MFTFIVALCLGHSAQFGTFEVVDRDGTCYQTQDVTTESQASQAAQQWYAEFGDGSGQPYWGYSRVNPSLTGAEAGGVYPWGFSAGAEW